MCAAEKFFACAIWLFLPNGVFLWANKSNLPYVEIPR